MWFSTNIVWHQSTLGEVFYEKFNTRMLTGGIFQPVFSVQPPPPPPPGWTRLDSARLPGRGQTAAPFTKEAAKQQQLDTSEQLPPITAAPSFY